MELRHLRYFIAVTEERSFAHAARRLRVAQPALSKQIRDLEYELGVALFHRLPRGVRLTPAGEAFRVEARGTLERAAHAVESARGAGASEASTLRFAHGELVNWAAAIEGLLAAFRGANPEVQVRVSSLSDAEAPRGLREHRIEVASVFIAQWPVEGFDAHRLLYCPATGVLLPANHPLASRSVVRMEELQGLSWLHSAAQRWPGFMRTFEAALRDRGLVPQRRRQRPNAAPSANIQIAAGETWALANEEVAAPYRGSSTAIVYRPFLEPPIPCWLALVWLPTASPKVERLVEVAREQGLAVEEEAPATQIA